MKNPVTAVAYALKTGQLVRQPCRVCGNPKVQAHHADYAKPLEVDWLCVRHHNELHSEMRLRGESPLNHQIMRRVRGAEMTLRCPTKKVKRLIVRSARRLGVSVNTFVRDAMLARADAVLGKEKQNDNSPQ